VPRPPASFPFALGLTLALAAGAAAAATGARAALPVGDAATLEAKRHDLKARVEAVQRELATAETSRADAADALKETALALSAATRRLHEFERERVEVEAGLAGLDAQRVRLEQQVASEQTLLARLLLQQQTGGRQEPLKLLLSGRDPGDIARLLYYLHAIGEMRLQAITRLRSHQQQVQALAEQANVQRERLAALARDEAGLRADLERQRSAHAQVLARVAGDIRRQQRELDRLQRDDLRLSRLLDRLAELARTRPPSRREGPAARAGGAAGPDKTAAEERSSVPSPADSGLGLQRGRLSMPVRGELANRFGASRSDGALSWKGWFIRCAAGQEVKVIAAGQVVYADWLRGFGNLLIVDHGDGYMSLYGNNDALYASVGSAVVEGEAIAQAGSSGGGGEPGVYFEIRHQGKAMDPASWIGR
jgi:septal ring factor EnvC (AmiA/AmiB activator)